MNLSPTDMMSLIQASYNLISEEIQEGGLVKIVGNVDAEGEIGKVVQKSQANYGVEMLTGSKKGTKVSFSQADVEEIVLDSLESRLDDDIFAALEDGDAGEDEYEALKEVVAGSTNEEDNENQDELPNQFVLKIDTSEASDFNKLLDDAYKVLTYDEIRPGEYGFDEFEDLYHSLIKGIEEEEVVTLSGVIIKYRDEDGKVQKQTFSRDDLGELYNFYDEVKGITKDKEAPEGAEAQQAPAEEGML